MMDRTDRHFRRFLRRMTRRSLLYTEMIVAGAVLHGDRDRLLGFDEVERPLALQLGGDDPASLARAARIGAERGYDEINLNVGCPSDRVRDGRFGVCLMAEPERVAAAVAAMRGATDVPVTVKHRIGFDELDRYEDMARFVETVARAGCDRFIVHARKAWLGGLSPRENRSVPPLRYEDVYRLKAELPSLRIEINGGIDSLAAVREHLDRVDGAMVGRAACDDPWLFARADLEVFGEPGDPPTRREVLEATLEDAASWLARGVPLGRLAQPAAGLFAGLPGARAWRRALGEGARAADVSPLRDALALVPSELLDERPGPAPRQVPVATSRA
jgi:tRNA-dihydrouridine synthase A